MSRMHIRKTSCEKIRLEELEKKLDRRTRRTKGMTEVKVLSLPHLLGSDKNNVIIADRVLR